MQGKRNLWALLTLCTAALVWAGPASADIILYDFGINVDGTTTCLGGPCTTDGVGDLSGVAGINDGGFDYISGLGTITLTLSGTGAHNVDLFLDHEMSETINTYYNESGATGGGGPMAGQSWEIDEPGYVFGDILLGDGTGTFQTSALDNFNNVPAGLEDDVSMALGWDFTLAAGETAIATFITSESMPLIGFYLSQTDPDSAEMIYFSSMLEIRGGEPPTGVPEPGTVTLLGMGLLGLAGFGRRRRTARARIT